MASDRFDPSIASLAWMAGCWERREADEITEEHWMRPAAGLMMGMSRTLRGGALAEYEVLRIEQGDGQLILTASPSGQPTAEFRADSISANAVVFTNPAHNFPTSIGYRAVDTDSLHAWIEGLAAGNLRRIEFPMTRASC